MCRSIKTLYNFDPPASTAEIQAAALQYVRKISGYRQPSQINEAAFNTAVAEIAATSQALLAALETKTPPKNRVEEAQKAQQRAAKRFG